MAPTTYTFDPDGDLVLVLSKPSKTTDTTSQKSAKGAAVPSSNKRKRVTSTQSVPVAEPEKIHMTVSSKHMMLASPVFKAMLQPGCFREGIQRNAAGQMEVDLPDDDQPIMVIVLNIVHGRNRLVPKQVDLEMMSKLAILVDKYQMVEAVESFSNPWIDDLITRETLPIEYLDFGDIGDRKRIQRWLAVSWVFRRPNEFSKFTAAAIIGCGSNVADELDAELPMPETVIESIARERVSNMSKMLEVVKGTIKKYEGKKVNCPCAKHGADCDAMVLGSLIKSMVEGDVWPIPKSPYQKLTLDHFWSTIFCLDIKTLCSNNGTCQRQPWSNNHGVSGLIQKTVNAIKGKITGLDIKTFKR